MNVLVQLQIIISGTVQGVGFRYFTQMKAVQYGITGWVKNRSDGTVEIVAVGEKEDLDHFIHILRQGNPFSKVSDIKITELADSEPFQSFKIKY